MIGNPYSRLTNKEKKEILAKLSKKQRDIFEALTKVDVRGSALGKSRVLEEIIEESDLPAEIVVNHIQHIEAEIRKLVPNFGKRNVEFREIEDI